MRLDKRSQKHGPVEIVGNTPQEHHHIGLSQNLHEHIGTFLRKHAGDPAIKVCAMHGMTYFIECSLLLKGFSTEAQKTSSSAASVKYGGQR